MANVLHEEDIIVAFNLLTGNDICDIEDVTIGYKSPSAEQMLIKEEMYMALSNEAKEVIDIILNGPAEVLNQICTPIKKAITMKRLRMFFECYFSSEFITKSTIKEIKKWANQL